jgi:hypothetical protein
MTSRAWLLGAAAAAACAGLVACGSAHSVRATSGKASSASAGSGATPATNRNVAFVVEAVGTEANQQAAVLVSGNGHDLYGPVQLLAACSRATARPPGRAV